jgi:hypothetical protein
MAISVLICSLKLNDKNKDGRQRKQNAWKQKARKERLQPFKTAIASECRGYDVFISHCGNDSKRNFAIGLETELDCNGWTS